MFLDLSGSQHGMEIQQQILQGRAQIDRQHDEIKGARGRAHHPMQILVNKEGASDPRLFASMRDQISKRWR